MPPKNLYLTGKAARYLRGLGHHLAPKAMLGREGITPTLRESVLAILTADELIKVKIQEGCPLGKTEAAEGLAAATHSRIAQIIGRTFLLFRPNPERKPDQKIILPK